MKYLDSNTLIYATLNKGSKGEWCRDLLSRIENGEERAGTSYLTYDEVFWKVNKSSSKKYALEATECILTMPNLRFFEVDGEIIWKAHEFIEEESLDPRDAIHLSTAINHGIYTVVTEHSDFDQIRDVDREWIGLE